MPGVDHAGGDIGSVTSAAKWPTAGCTKCWLKRWQIAFGADEGAGGATSGEVAGSTSKLRNGRGVEAESMASSTWIAGGRRRRYNKEGEAAVWRKEEYEEKCHSRQTVFKMKYI